MGGNDLEFWRWVAVNVGLPWAIAFAAVIAFAVVWAL